MPDHQHAGRGSDADTRHDEGAPARSASATRPTAAHAAPVAGLAFGPRPDDPLGGTSADPSVTAALRRRRGRGSPLPREVAEDLGARFGEDLSDVRIHHDGEADEIARSVDAEAFTAGTDIYFTQGKYRPADRASQHLLAHELAHVQQHRRGSASTTTGTVIGRADDAAEVEADRVASEVVSGGRSTASPSAPAAGQHITLRRNRPRANAHGATTMPRSVPSSVQRLLRATGATGVDKLKGKHNLFEAKGGTVAAQEQATRLITSAGSDAQIALDEIVDRIIDRNKQTVREEFGLASFNRIHRLIDGQLKALVEQRGLRDDLELVLTAAYPTEHVARYLIAVLDEGGRVPVQARMSRALGYVLAPKNESEVLELMEKASDKERMQLWETFGEDFREKEKFKDTIALALPVPGVKQAVKKLAQSKHENVTNLSSAQIARMEALRGIAELKQQRSNMNQKLFLAELRDYLDKEAHALVVCTTGGGSSSPKTLTKLKGLRTGALYDELRAFAGRGIALEQELSLGGQLLSHVARAKGPFDDALKGSKFMTESQRGKAKDILLARVASDDLAVVETDDDEGGGSAEWKEREAREEREEKASRAVAIADFMATLSRFKAIKDDRGKSRKLRDPDKLRAKVEAMDRDTRKQLLGQWVEPGQRRLWMDPLTPAAVRERMAEGAEAQLRTILKQAGLGSGVSDTILKMLRYGDDSGPGYLKLKQLAEHRWSDRTSVHSYGSMVWTIVRTLQGVEFEQVRNDRAMLDRLRRFAKGDVKGHHEWDKAVGFLKLPSDLLIEAAALPEVSSAPEALELSPALRQRTVGWPWQAPELPMEPRHHEEPDAAELADALAQVRAAASDPKVPLTTTAASYALLAKLKAKATAWSTEKGAKGRDVTVYLLAVGAHVEQKAPKVANLIESDPALRDLRAVLHGGPLPDLRTAGERSEATRQDLEDDESTWARLIRSHLNDVRTDLDELYSVVVRAQAAGDRWVSRAEKGNPRTLAQFMSKIHLEVVKDKNAKSCLESKTRFAKVQAALKDGKRITVEDRLAEAEGWDKRHQTVGTTKSAVVASFEDVEGDELLREWTNLQEPGGIEYLGRLRDRLLAQRADLLKALIERRKRGEDVSGREEYARLKEVTDWLHDVEVEIAEFLPGVNTKRLAWIEAHLSGKDRTAILMQLAKKLSAAVKGDPAFSARLKSYGMAADKLDAERFLAVATLGEQRQLDSGLQFTKTKVAAKSYGQQRKEAANEYVSAQRNAHVAARDAVGKDAETRKQERKEHAADLKEIRGDLGEATKAFNKHRDLVAKVAKVIIGALIIAAASAATAGQAVWVAALVAGVAALGREMAAKTIDYAVKGDAVASKEWVQAAIIGVVKGGLKAATVGILDVLDVVLAEAMGMIGPNASQAEIDAAFHGITDENIAASDWEFGMAHAGVSGAVKGLVLKIPAHYVKIAVLEEKPFRMMARNADALIEETAKLFAMAEAKALLKTMGGVGSAHLRTTGTPQSMQGGANGGSGGQPTLQDELTAASTDASATAVKTTGTAGARVLPILVQNVWVLHERQPQKWKDLKAAAEASLKGLKKDEDKLRKKRKPAEVEQLDLATMLAANRVLLQLADDPDARWNTDLIDVVAELIKTRQDLPA